MSVGVDYSGLLNWQPAAVDGLLVALQKHNAALDASDLGTGKSFHALAVMRALDLPTLVVVPAVSISSWRRAGEQMGVKFSILNYEAIRGGKSPYGTWERPRPKVSEKVFTCEACQQKFTSPEEIATRRCPHQRVGIHSISVKTRPHKYGKFKWHDNIKFLVFDECHRTSALDSLQAELLIAAKRQRISTLGISATPAESPLDFRALGYLLGLHTLVDTPSSPGFFKWAFARGVRKFPLGGFHFAVGEDRKKSIMAGIHKEIFPDKGVRVRIEDLGTAFPEVQTTAELYDLAEAGRIDALYSEMDSAIAHLNAEKSEDKNQEHPLTVLLRASQEIELLTVPVYESLVADALAQGLHAAIFVTYRRTVEELCRRLKTVCRVDGSQTGEAGQRARQTCVERFQSDEESVIVCSQAAGSESISLHDERGKYPRIGFVAPGNNARRIRQIMGRLRRATGKSKAFYRFICIAGTVQEKIHKQLQSKLDCMDALNDSDLMAANLPLNRHSISEILKDE